MTNSENVLVCVDMHTVPVLLSDNVHPFDMVYPLSSVISLIW